MLTRVAWITLLLVPNFIAPPAVRQFGGRAPAGPIPGRSGNWILPNGRRITPEGRRILLGNFPLGIAQSPDGRWLFVINNGAGRQSVQVVSAVTGAVTQTVPEPTVFNGIVVSTDGATVWVAGGGAGRVLEFGFRAGRLTRDRSVSVPGYPAGLALTPDGQTLLVTCNLAHHAALIDASSGRVTATIRTGVFPFAAAMSPDGKSGFVTNWADGTVTVVDLATREVHDTIEVGRLPSAIAVDRTGNHAYVANANSDTISVLDIRSRHVVRTLSIRPYPRAPYGSVPDGLALSPDGTRLYVALAGLNAVACYDTRTFRQMAMTPVAWYPTGIVVSGAQRCVFAVCSKGVGSGPNADGHYIGHMIRGTLERLPLDFPAAGAAAVAANNGYASRPTMPALPRAITHCVLIVRENRTFDQDLGDFRGANADPALCMYGARVTPNLHGLAARFAIGDNFYSDGEVSAQGHQWTLGANCSDYVEKTWMAYYSDRGRLRDSPWAPVTYSAAGSFMLACARHGVSCRMYGDAVPMDSRSRPLPETASYYDPRFVGFNLGYPDVRRVDEWLREFRAGVFPAFSYIWLPNDHTAGGHVGSLSPRSLVADNDVATGRVVDAISHSAYWISTAVFLCEDDSQDGRDHVDAHRNILLVASPWVRRGTVTSRHYSQVSIWATIERFLHLPPMSQYDDLAHPITGIWSPMPDRSPFSALAARVPLDERNPAGTAAARASAALDLSEPDADRTGRLEAVLWEMAHGAPRAGR